jgi:malate permease and related proteins
VIGVVVAIVVATALGVAAHRRFGERALRATRATIRILLWTVLPFIAFFSITRLDVDGRLVGGLGLAYVALTAVALLAWFMGTRVLGLTAAGTGALIVTCIVANTGYLGIPLSAELFGSEGLGQAVAFDNLVNSPIFLTVGLAIGAGLGTRAGSTPAERVRSFLRGSPPLFAVAAALVAPDALSPDLLHDAAETLAYLVLPVGFLIVGVTLSSEADEGAVAFPPPMSAPVATALVLRLVVAPGLLLGLSAAFGAVPDTFVLEAAMPTGVNALVVGHAYGLDLRIASSALAWSTAIVVVAILGYAVAG